MADLPDAIAEADALAGMDAEALVLEIAAMAEEHAGLEADLAEKERELSTAKHAYTDAVVAVGACEARRAAAWDALRRRMLDDPRSPCEPIDR